MNHREINRAIKLLDEVERIFESNHIYLDDTPSLMARQLEDMLKKEKTWEQRNAESFMDYTESLNKIEKAIMENCNISPVKIWKNQDKQVRRTK